MSEVNNAPSAPESSAPVQSSAEPKQEQSSTPPVPQKKKFKYKADGAEVEEELDDNEIANRLSLAKGAQKRMQEASTTKKQMENFFKALQENPLEVLNDDRIMGSKKFREIAENYLIEQLKLEQMSPEQRLQMERDKELERYKQSEKERKEQEEQSKQEQLSNQYRQQFEKTIIDALETAGLPKNAKTVSRMAQLLQLSIKNGIEADSKMLVQMVKDDYQSDLKGLIKDLGPEQLIAMFGDDIANKIRKYDLGRLTPKNPVPTKPTIQKEAPIAKKLSPREFDEQIRARLKV